MSAPYLTFVESDEVWLLRYFILQKDFPHFMMVISEQPIKKIFLPVPINGYKLWVVFHGCLRGNVIPSYHDVDEELRVIMSDMADWYLNNRILTNEKKYKKWKL